MRTFKLKSGNVISVSSIDALLGTIWVPKLIWQGSGITFEEKQMLQKSVKMTFKGD